MKTADDFREIVDLYALGALEGRERADFESHLIRCSDCRQQLDEALSVLSVLTPDSPAPAHVWDRIAEDIRGNKVVPLRKAPSTNMMRNLIAIAAALAIALGGVLVSRGQESSLAAAAAQAASDSNATVAELVVDRVKVAEVILTDGGQGYVVPTEALEDLAEGRTYQLWVINQGGRVISGGVLGNAPQVSSFTWTDGVSGFALTREVAGGVEVSEGDLVAAVTDL